MRHIGSIKDAAHAERFSAYLMVQGIASHVELEDSDHAIWVKDEDRLTEAIQMLDDFNAQPDAPVYVEAREQAESLIREEIEQRKQVQKNIVNVRERWPQGIRRRAPMAIALIIISVAVGFLTGFGSMENRDGTAKSPDQMSAAIKGLVFNFVEGDKARGIINKKKSDDDLSLRLASIYRGEIWRIFTPIFIHFGPIHLLFNMIWMFHLGRLLEDRFGTPFFAMIVVLTAVIPNFLQMVVPEWMDGAAPYYYAQAGGDAFIIALLGGMSGVVYGLFGFAWIRSKLDPSCGFMIPQSTVIILLGWMFLGFTSFDETLLNISMANWGHAGGLVVGMLVAYFSVQISRSKVGRTGKRS